MFVVLEEQMILAVYVYGSVRVVEPALLRPDVVLRLLFVVQLAGVYFIMLFEEVAGPSVSEVNKRRSRMLVNAAARAAAFPRILLLCMRCVAARTSDGPPRRRF